MKYQELYDHAMENECTVVEFDTNVIPTKGWAITRVVSPLFLNVTPEQFDISIDWARRKGEGSTHLIITKGEHHGIRVGNGVVYNDQQFAMGYAMGRGVDFIIDCYTGKKVMRR